MRPLRMLAACEMSGLVADAFARRGWEAHSCDLLPGEKEAMDYQDIVSLLSDSEHGMHGSYRHHQCDISEMFDWYHPANFRRRHELTMREAPPLWDLVIAFPPCTHLSLAGARYWKEKRLPRYDENLEEIWSVQDEAAAFFMQFADCAPHWAIENPRGDMARRWRRPDQIVEPFYFGDPKRKKICLWRGGLPPLLADNVVAPEGRVATGGGSHRTDIRAGRGRQNGYEDSRGRRFRSIMRSMTSEQVARAMAEQWGGYLEGLYRDRG